MDFLKNNISKLLEIVDRNDSSETQLKEDTKFIDEVAQKEKYVFKNPKIEKVAITIDKVVNIPKQFQAVTDLFGMGSDLVSMISGTGGFAENVKTLLKNEVPDIIMEEIKPKEDIIKNLKPIATLPQSPSTAMQVQVSMENYIDMVQKYIDFINNLLDIADSIDPEYRKTFENKILNIDLGDYQWNSNNGNYAIKNRKSRDNLAYNEYLQLFNDLKKYLDAEKNNALYAQFNGADITLPKFNTDGRKNIKKQFDIFINEIKEHINSKSSNLADEIQVGGSIDSIKNAVLLALQRKINILKAEELLKVLGEEYNKIEEGKQETQKKETKMEDDMSAPLMALISYSIGSLNAYDTELLNYCQRIGLDVSTTLAIYFAQNRHDVSYIISKYAPLQYPALLNILRLKKLSASEKFRQNYGLSSDGQVGVLWEKRSIWSH